MTLNLEELLTDIIDAFCNRTVSKPRIFIICIGNKEAFLCIGKGTDKTLVVTDPINLYAAACFRQIVADCQMKSPKDRKFTIKHLGEVGETLDVSESIHETELAEAIINDSTTSSAIADIYIKFKKPFYTYFKKLNSNSVL